MSAADSRRRLEADGGFCGFLGLVGFRRDILLTLACIGPTHGQGLADDLARLRNEEINDGRFYPHLNALVDDEFVEKRENEHDNRSHEYALTEIGRESIREHAQRLTDAVEAIDGGVR